MTLDELAQRLDAVLHGEPGQRIERVATLTGAGDGDISFISHKRYRRELEKTAASAVLLREDDRSHLAEGVAALVVGDPYLAYARVAGWLYPRPDEGSGIHPTAVVEEGAQVAADAWIGPQSVIEAGAVIGAGCRIGPGCMVGRGAEIGEGGRLEANVTVCHDVRIGRRVQVHPGAVIGADGFGFANDAGRWVKIPQVGSVVIGDDVEIGANTTIDRGAIEDTRIADGVIIDNLVQVAHNVQVGEHSALAGCVGIAGSARIGAHCALGGGVGVVGHLQICDNAVVTGMTMVNHPISEPGVYSSGTPMQENAKWHRNAVRFKQLDDMARRLRQLEKHVKDKNTE